MAKKKNKKAKKAVKSRARAHKKPGKSSKKSRKAVARASRKPAARGKKAPKKAARKSTPRKEPAAAAPAAASAVVVADEIYEELSWRGGEDREALEDFRENPEELVAQGEDGGGAERSPGRTEDDEEETEW